MNDREKISEAAEFKDIVLENLNKDRPCVLNNSECQGLAINSHSIRKASLKRIITNNKVYGFDTFNPSKRIELEKMCMEPSPISLDIASAYHVFCSIHDKQIFQKIEDLDIIPDSEQGFLFYFRTVVFNYFQAHCQDEITETNEVPNFSTEKLDAFKAESLPIIDEQYNIINSDRLSRGFDDYQSLFIRIDKVPEIMCCLFHIPCDDFNGSEIPFSSTLRKYMGLAINILNDNQGGYIIFTWHKLDNISRQFVKSFIDVKFNFNLLLSRLFLLSPRGFFFDQKWWDGLTSKVQSTLKCYPTLSTALVNAADANLIFKIQQIAMNDRTHYVDWNVTYFETINF